MLENLRIFAISLTAILTYTGTQKLFRLYDAWQARRIREYDSHTFSEVCGIVGIILLIVSAVILAAGFGG